VGNVKAEKKWIMVIGVMVKQAKDTGKFQKLVVIAHLMVQRISALFFL
jgi:hypothetical protein